MINPFKFFILFSFTLQAVPVNLKAAVPLQTSGEIKTIIPELDADETVLYETGKPGWIEVNRTRSFAKSKSMDQAEQELLQLLRNDAISKKVPTNVVVTSLLSDVTSESGGKASEQTAWSGFFRSTVSGLITAEKILFNRLQEEENGFSIAMGLKAYVEPVKGQRDPGFYVDIMLENNRLISGDELAFSVTPSKDCYVYVFNLMADQNVMLMFPNEFLKENYVKGKSTLQIPDPEIRRYIKFRVSPMPGEEITSENIYIVCTKEEVSVVRDLPKIGKSFKVFSGNSQSFVKLQRWLTNIPLNQRVEKDLVYHISNN